MTHDCKELTFKCPYCGGTSLVRRRCVELSIPVEGICDKGGVLFQWLADIPADDVICGPWSGAYFKCDDCGHEWGSLEELRDDRALQPNT